MKNILVTLAFVLFACCSHAEASGFDKPVDDYDPDTQTSGTYTFKGIPIKGTVSEFSRKLQQQGYKYEYLPPSPDKEQVGLTGKFMGQDVYIYLFGEKNSHETYDILVFFYKAKEYITTYRNIRNLLSQKYNDPHKWLIEDTSDMKEYPNMETIEAIRQGNYRYSYRIFGNNNVDRPYIVLTWSAAGIALEYYNPYTLDKVMKKYDQLSMSDL